MRHGEERALSWTRRQLQAVAGGNIFKIFLIPFASNAPDKSMHQHTTRAVGFTFPYGLMLISIGGDILAPISANQLLVEMPQRA